MSKILKISISLFVCMLMMFFISCGNSNNKNKIAEKVTLASTVISEVEFENSEAIKIEQKNDNVNISGNINEMSLSQKSAFGKDGVSYVVVLKFEFDKERTLDTFEIVGENTKVYSTDKSKENFVGLLSDLLDNEPSEDSFAYLVLSAQTKNYQLKTTYTDESTSVINLKIDASLVSSS